MSETIKEAADITSDTVTVKKEKEVKHYENSHLVMYCGKCNSRYILEENIPSNKGISINLPPTSESEFILVCKDCGNKMGLFYVESVQKNDAIAEPKKEIEADEPIKKTNRKK